MVRRRKTQRRLEWGSYTALALGPAEPVGLGAHRAAFPTCDLVEIGDPAAHLDEELSTDVVMPAVAADAYPALAMGEGAPNAPRVTMSQPMYAVMDQLMAVCYAPRVVALDGSADADTPPPDPLAVAADARHCYLATPTDTHAMWRRINETLGGPIGI